MKKIFSSGGVGDALIVGLKLQQLSNTNEAEWTHYEKHACHEKPCLDIMKQFAKKSNMVICNRPQDIALDMCQKENGLYIDTKIIGHPLPYLNKPLGKKIKKDPGFQYVVINAAAGRMHDNTKRVIDPEIVNDIMSLIPNKKIIVLGPEKMDFGKQVINLSGETESIIDAFEIINGSSCLIGFDGVLSYYSLMLGKPTIVFYHAINLVHHYWNDIWSTHALAYSTNSNKINRLPPTKNIAKFMDNIINE